MAWRCSGPTNEGLVDNLWTHGLIKSMPIKQAFLQVDRAHYAPAAPYDDRPQAIGFGATISAPHMHASALEHLRPFILPSSPAPPPAAASPPRPRRVLDIGCGSGYLTHAIAELAASPDGPRHAASAPLVVGLDHIPGLVRLSEANMRKSPRGRALLDQGLVRLVVGDGRKGLNRQSLIDLISSQQQEQQQQPAQPPEALEAKDDGSGAEQVHAIQQAQLPREDEGEELWDAIHVGASAREIHPELVAQLRRPGRMFVPVDDDKTGRSQHIWQVDKDAEGVVHSTKLFGVRYVPLTDGPAEGGE